MTIYSILGLSVAMFLLAITPGPGVFATVSKALSSGFKHSIPVIIGIVIGDLIFLLLAIYGLSAVAETFGTLFVVIKYLGAAYLIWLGIRLWQTHPAKTDIISSEYRSGKYSFLAGLSITLGNPKVILFYLGFLPTFVDLEALSSIDVAIVVFVVSLVLGSVMLFYAYTASRVKVVFKSETAQCWVNRAAGSAMIATGAILIAKT